MRSADAVKEAQVAYHDWEASRYDAKFSISYDQRCIDYASARFRKAVPEGGRYERVLEVGAGTGFFVINLWQAGYLGSDVHATDISPQMLTVCRRNAAEHGLALATHPGDAEDLPYPDRRFDLVIGHAILHHLPEPERALHEMCRVLVPGGLLVVAGEPTVWGDRILRRVKRSTYLAVRALTAFPTLRSWRRDGDHALPPDEAALAALEWQVDLHTFDPRTVEQLAQEAGFAEVRTVTEDLTASWLGWAVRTVEGTVAPARLGMRWALWAYRNYLRLQRLDEHVLARLVPKPLFYNLILVARRPQIA